MVANNRLLNRVLLFSIFLFLVAGETSAWSAPLTAKELLENDRLREHIQELKD